MRKKLVKIIALFFQFQSTMRQGETSQEVKNDENMYSLPFEHQKISSNEYITKEKKKINGDMG